MTMVDRLIVGMTATGLDYSDWHPDPKRELAIAALKAMKDPSDEMLRKFLSDGWDAMIDAALSEQP